MEYAPMIIDIILVIVVLASAISAYKSGFLTSLINLFGSVAGLVLAWFASNKYSVLLFDKFFKEKLVAKTFEYIQQSTNAINVKVMIEELVGGLPPSLMESFITKAEDAAANLTDPSLETASLIVDTFLGPILTLAIGVAMFVVIILLCKILTSLLASGLKIVNHIPIVGFVNRIAGFVVGLAIGGINVILLSCFLSIIVIITQNSLSFLNISILTQSQILALTKAINPFMG